VNWISADLRGRDLKSLFGLKCKATQHSLRPWSTDLPAEKNRPARYVKKADRPTSRDWNFRVHLDIKELDAADQFFHDWKLAGLQPNSNAAGLNLAWLGPEVREDSSPPGMVPRRGRYGEFDRHDNKPAEPGIREVLVSITAAELREMSKPKSGRESDVDLLVAEYLAAGGTVKKGQAFMTRRGRVDRIVEYIVPQAAPIRDVSVTDAAHAMPLSWSQARHRRVWRWARKTLRPDEASLVERVVLHGEPTAALPTLKAALGKLAEHYAQFDPAEGLRHWEDCVRSHMGAAA
jgi:hypothetical protein